MKYILATLALFFGMQSFASGKLSLTQFYFENSKTYKPMLGLSVYEKLTDSVAYNSWTGWGQPDLSGDKEQVDWYTSKQGVDFYFKKFTFGTGVQFMYVQPENKWSNRAYFKAEYNLW